MWCPQHQPKFPNDWPFHSGFLFSKLCSFGSFWEWLFVAFLIWVSNQSSFVHDGREPACISLDLLPLNLELLKMEDGILKGIVLVKVKDSTLPNVEISTCHPTIFAAWFRAWDSDAHWALRTNDAALARTACSINWTGVMPCALAIARAILATFGDSSTCSGVFSCMWLYGTGPYCPCQIFSRKTRTNPL